MKKTSSGFTIVELLIVVVVIGILATISVVAYTGIQNRAKNSQIQAAVASYASSLRALAVDTGALPTTGQTGGSYACLGVYDDNSCANAAGIITRPLFDSLLLQYRGGNGRPTLPEEYIYTNNYNNWWRGVWYYVEQSQLLFVQYNSSTCPAITGTSAVLASNAYNGHILCRVRVEI